MAKSRIIRVAPEFDEMLNREIEKLRVELEDIFGIKVSKPKATKYITKKIEENGGLRKNGFF